MKQNNCTCIDPDCSTDIWCCKCEAYVPYTQTARKCHALENFISELVLNRQVHLTKDQQAALLQLMIGDEIPEEYITWS